METHFGFSIVFAAVKWTVRCVGYNSKLLRVEGMTMRHRGEETSAGKDVQLWGERKTLG